MKCTCNFDNDKFFSYTTHCGCEECEYPPGAPIVGRTKASKPMNDIVHARELDIHGLTTVGELFELIDLPYRVTKKAVVSIVPRRQPNPGVESGRTLRIEWRGEGA